MKVIYLQLKHKIHTHIGVIDKDPIPRHFGGSIPVSFYPLFSNNHDVSQYNNVCIFSLCFRDPSEEEKLQHTIWSIRYLIVKLTKYTTWTKCR